MHMKHGRGPRLESKNSIRNDVMTLVERKNFVTHACKVEYCTTIAQQRVERKIEDD